MVLSKRKNLAMHSRAAIVALVLAALFGCSGKNTDYGPQVSAKEAESGAQKAIDQLKANTTMPANLKNAQIKHLEQEIAEEQGRSGGPTKTGPPPMAKK